MQDDLEHGTQRENSDEILVDEYDPPVDHGPPVSGPANLTHQESTASTKIVNPDMREVARIFKSLKIYIVGAGLLAGFVLLFTKLPGSDSILVNRTLGVGVWMATLWLTGFIPQVVTAFLPLVLFPALGVLKAGEVANQYANNTIWLMISGFLVALTIERWDIHRRISLKTLSYCGNKPGPLLLGIMGATFFLSMFISNTAASLMMVTNGESILKTLSENSHRNFRKHVRQFGLAVMLGIAYAANVGGLSSLIGTPPNLVFVRQLDILFPGAPEINFVKWWGFALPIGLIVFAIVYAYLYIRYLRGFPRADHIDRGFFSRLYTDMGPWSREQVITATLFTWLCCMWIFRANLSFGSFTIQGWTRFFPEPSHISDATIGMCVVFLYFVIPARKAALPAHANVESQKYSMSRGSVESALDEDAFEDERNDDEWTTLLDWHTAKNMPFDIVFLLGGGYALAKGFVASGLTNYVGEQIANSNVSVGAMILIMTLVIVWLTELTSNTSTSNIIIPIAGSLAIATKSSPYSFMITAAMACSCAFFLPIATPPNMVVFSTGRVPLIEMNKAGILLNLICPFILLAAAFTIIPSVTGVDTLSFPEGWLPEETAE